MNILIRLILEIIEAVFERDTQERAPAPAPPRPGQRPNGPQPQPNTYAQAQPDLASQNDVRQSLQDMLRQLQSGAQPPPIPPPARAHRTRTRKAEETETLREHIAQQEAHIAELERRAQALAEHTREHLGVFEGGVAGAGPQFAIPGNTPLERMVMAGVVLGPCKAHQSRRLL